MLTFCFSQLDTFKLYHCWPCVLLVWYSTNYAISLLFWASYSKVMSIQISHRLAWYCRKYAISAFLARYSKFMLIQILQISGSILYIICCSCISQQNAQNLCQFRSCKFLVWYARKNAVLAFFSKILKIYVYPDLSNFWLDTLDRMCSRILQQDTQIYFNSGLANLWLGTQGRMQLLYFSARYSKFISIQILELSGLIL